MQILPIPLRRTGFFTPVAVALGVLLYILPQNRMSAANGNDTWNPSGTSIYWSAASNWTGTNTPPISGDSLIFGADNSAGTSNAHALYNDLTTLAFNLGGITFNTNAPAYTFVGNAFTLTGSIADNSTATQTIADSFALSAGAHNFALASGATLNLSGNITGANVNGSILATGGGTVTLGGTDSFTTTGGTNNILVNAAGTLAITGTTTISLGSNDYVGVGGGSGGALTVAAGGTLNVSGGNNGLYIGVFSGGLGALTINGTLNLASTTPLNVSALSASGGVVNLNSGGVLAIGSAINGGSGTNPTFNFNGGTIKATAAGGGTISGFTTVTAANSTQSTIDSNNFTTGISSVISGGGSLRIIDSSGNNSGLVTLSGPNTFSGGVTLSTGGLLVNNAAAAGTGTLTLAGGSLIDNANFNNAVNVTGSVTVANLYDNPDGAHSGALSGAGTLTIGAVTVTSGTYAPTNSFKYNGSLSSFTGTFVDNSNTNVILQGAASAGSTSAKFQVNASPFYVLAGSGITTFNAGELSGGTSGGINLNGMTLSAGALNTTSTYAGTLASLALTKVGTGTLTLSGTSTYSGGTSVSAGTLQLNAIGSAGTGTIAVGSSGTLAIAYGGSQANVITGTGAINTYNFYNNVVLSGDMSGFTGTINVGTASGNGGKTVVTTYMASDPHLTAGTTINVASGGTFFDFGITVPSTINVSGTGNSEGFGALRLDNGAVLSGPVNLLGTITVGNFATSTVGTISGVISGSGFGLTKVTPNPIILTGANTYTGTTTISAGTLQLGSGGTTGKLATGSAIVDNANFTINRSNAVTQGTDFSGAAITGSGSFTQAGTGNTYLNAANAYSGGTNVNAGVLAAAGVSPSEFGTGTVTLGSAGSLYYNVPVNTTVNTYTNNLVLNGGGLYSIDGDTHLGNATSTIAVNAATTITRQWGGGGTAKKLSFDGIVSGSAALTLNGLGNGFNEGGGLLIGNNANTYSGTITVNSASGSGMALIEGGTTALQYATVNNLGNGAGNVPYGFRFNSGVTAPVVGALSGTGNIALQDLAGTPAAVTLTTGGNNASTTYSGVLSSNGGLTKAGTGAFTLTGANTYTGATAVNAGTLLVNGSLANASTVTVTNSGTILGGSGTVGGAVTINANANLSPGATTTAGATAKLTVGALTLNTNANLLLDILSATAGSGYDQVITTGAVSINGSNLVVNVSGASLSVGQKFFIVDNGSASAITGTFAGLANNATFTSGVVLFRVNYFDTGDSTAGNDISVSVVSVPEPATWAGGLLTSATLISFLRKKRRR